MIKLTYEGYVFVSKSGIQYELLEGMSIGVEPKYTSDIVFIMLDNPDFNLDNYFVGFLYGARVLENNLNDYEKSIATMVDEFEEKEGLK